MRFILDFIFPKKCLGCQKSGGDLCSQCVLSINQKELICPQCKRPAIGGATHPICRRRYGLDGLWSFGAFNGPLRRGIQKIKYKWVIEIAEIFINLLILYIAKNSPFFLDQLKKDHGKNWLVCGVPLHRYRQNWRGFNQSELLGKLLADKLGLKYENLLVRTKNTKPQVALKAFERHSNIKNAFALSMNHELKTMNILLVDDVWTTGSTIKECCWILKRSGAKSVWALTLAR